MMLRGSEVTRRRWRRAAAGICGGAVVMVGAITTLATEDGHTAAVGSFSAGEFDLQGSADGIVFSTRSGGASAVSLPMQADSLSPNDEVYVPFALRLGRGSTYAARVSVGLLAHAGAELGRARVYQTSRFGCASGADVVQAQLLGSLSGSEADAELLVAEPTGGADGEAVSLCLVFVAGPQLVQGAPGSVTWEFHGASVTA